jgi:hypothetical protein
MEAIQEILEIMVVVVLAAAQELRVLEVVMALPEDLLLVTQLAVVLVVVHQAMVVLLEIQEAQAQLELFFVMTCMDMEVRVVVDHNIIQDRLVPGEME